MADAKFSEMFEHHLNLVFDENSDTMFYEAAVLPTEGDSTVWEGGGSFRDLLDDLIEAGSIPSTPRSLRPEHRADLLKQLDSMKRDIKLAKKRVKAMKVWGADES